MIDKKTWKIGTDHDKMGKLIKCQMHVQYIKRLFGKEKTYSSNRKTVHRFFYEWFLELIGKFK